LNRVFINRTMNLKQINAIGFDMDHTLVRYYNDSFEELAFGFIVQKLVDSFHYPESIKKFKFKYDLAIRGLVIDQKSGMLLKLDRFRHIHSSFQGTRPVPYRELRKNYSDRMIEPSDPRFVSIDTTFIISVTSVYMQLVDLKIANKEVLPDFEAMASDVITAMDQAHGDGSLKEVVAKNLEKYIRKEPEVALGLERMKKHDKFLFIITNSEYEYAKTLLEYAIDPFLKEHDSFKDLFDLIIVGAQKPRFFQDSLRLMEVNPETGSLTNHFGMMKPGIFQGGHARQFEEDFGFQPHEILYMGDHIYGDILRLKKDRGWRTGLILEELDHEIQNLVQASSVDAQINKLMKEKESFEQQIQALESEQIENSNRRHKVKINSLFEKMRKIDDTLRNLILKSASYFNPNWGPIMRSGNMESYYAHQVIRFADIYMAELSALTNLSPRSYLRAGRRLLPHEEIET